MKAKLSLNQTDLLNFEKFLNQLAASFEGRVLSYEGKNFFLEGKDSKIISVTLNQLSKEDQKYLQETESW